MTTFSKKPNYLEFLQSFIDKPIEKIASETEEIFSSNVIKIVNGNTICSNRDELIKQMLDIKTTDKPHTIKLLESLSCNNKEVIQWEISFLQDNSTEIVITILTFNNGVIESINEVFAEKNSYQW